jgi:hypothetical protein
MDRLTQCAPTPNARSRVDAGVASMIMSVARAPLRCLVPDGDNGDNAMRTHVLAARTLPGEFALHA